MKRIAIVGTRPPPEPAFTRDGTPVSPERVARLREWLAIKRDVIAFLGTISGKIEVISGGARGVDTLAAENFGGPVSVLRADWRTHGKAAGMIRNGAIVAAADEVHAWPSSWSRGTWDTIRKARAAGKVCVVHEPWKEPA
jgi:hypothetical protein